MIKKSPGQKTKQTTGGTAENGSPVFLFFHENGQSLNPIQSNRFSINSKSRFFYNILCLNPIKNNNYILIPYAFLFFAKLCSDVHCFNFAN